jgi:hypothetical protein
MVTSVYEANILLGNLTRVICAVECNDVRLLLKLCKLAI